MALEPGSQLGPYEVGALLGRGGTGEVYRARDPKLRRDVAIKVLPDDLARDPDLLARLHREAQLLAALKHPHIAHIYGQHPVPTGRRAQAAPQMSGRSPNRGSEARVFT